jgi:hypothetical protein
LAISEDVGDWGSFKYLLQNKTLRCTLNYKEHLGFSSNRMPWRRHRHKWKLTMFLCQNVVALQMEALEKCSFLKLEALIT